MQAGLKKANGKIFLVWEASISLFVLPRLTCVNAAPHAAKASRCRATNSSYRDAAWSRNPQASATRPTSLRMRASCPA